MDNAQSIHDLLIDDLREEEIVALLSQFRELEHQIENIDQLNP